MSVSRNKSMAASAWDDVLRCRNNRDRMHNGWPQNCGLGMRINEGARNVQVIDLIRVQKDDIDLNLTILQGLERNNI